MDKDLQEQREKIEMQELFVKEYEKINEENSIVRAVCGETLGTMISV